MIDIKLFPIFLRQGRARAQFKVGYITQSGDVVIEPVFDEGTRFYEGLAAVRLGDEWGFVGANGKFIIQPQVWGVTAFSCNRSAVSVNGTWGVIDRTGSYVVQPRYSFLFPFYEGLAVFRSGEGVQSRYGFVDTNGIEVIPAIFRDAGGFSEGLAPVRENNLWGYIDRSCTYRIEPKFRAFRRGRRRVEKTRPGRFASGRAHAWVDGGYGFVDVSGEFVVAGQFEEAYSFSEGRARVKQNGRFGYLDLEGRVAIEPRFTYAHNFSEGLAAVTEKSSALGYFPPFGFVDPQGVSVLPCTYAGAESFENGLCLVETEKTIGYIDKRGDFVWQGPYVEHGVIQ